MGAASCGWLGSPVEKAGCAPPPRMLADFNPTRLDWLALLMRMIGNFPLAA
jgi:hypothetical protein